MTTQDEKIEEHNWSGWPGAYCLKCGIDDVSELIINCEKCRIPFSSEDENNPFYDGFICEEHKQTPCRKAYP